MVDAIVSTVLEHFTTVLIQQAEEEVQLVVGVDDEVDRMKSNFKAIQAVLADAEQKQLKDATVRDWLDKLSDVAYEIEDVLDEWNTAIINFKIQGDESGASSNSKRKVCSFISSPCFCCKKVALRRDIAYKIKELNGRLDVIAIEKDRYHFNLLVNSNQQPERQMTAPVIDVAEVQGREEDKNTIMNMLLTESSQGPLVPIISIVGMGGIGKTTLAKLVYNDDKVVAHFKKRVWVCVSDPFDEIRVAKAILEALMGSAPNLAELPALLEQIQSHVRGVKFLLVLDDVWTEDSRQWEQLKSSLMRDSPGSKIVVTTRKENVATSLGSRSIDMFRIGLLSIEQSWSLFSQIAFFGRDNMERENLEDIGRKIVDKCKCLPLAIKTLGSLLRFRNSKQEWQSVLDSELWEIEEAKRDLFAPLCLSYHELSPELKRCFSYCSIFPKDSVLKKNELIYLWMAQGYLRETRTKDKDIIGQEYFGNLAARSFFQDFENDAIGNIIRCKMHDMVHDFAQFLCKSECASIVAKDYEQERIDGLCRDARHLMMEVAKDAPFPVSFDRSMKLRSLLVEPNSHSTLGVSMPYLFNQLTCLRALKLSNFSIEKVADEVGKLIHLRHLDLSYSYDCLKELPEAVCELHNLQTLVLTGCAKLEKLPYSIGKLLNLMHLENSLTNMTFMPKGIEKLTALKTLDMLVVNGAGAEGEACTLECLCKLNLLQSIGISGLGSVRDVSEAKKAQLKCKKKLSSLSLIFDFHEPQAGERMVTDDQVIEALEPPPLTEILSITDYKGFFLPKWIITLNNLKKVDLRSCINCEHLPSLGILPLLENLQISYFMSVKNVGQEFLGIETDALAEKDNSMSSSLSVGFPKLKRLEFWDMNEWREWDGGVRAKGTVMPCLQYFGIARCPNLEALPDWLLQLQLKELSINSCHFLYAMYHPLKGTHGHKVSHISKVQIDNPSETTNRLVKEAGLIFMKIFNRN